MGSALVTAMHPWFATNSLQAPAMRLALGAAFAHSPTSTVLPEGGVIPSGGSAEPFLPTSNGSASAPSVSVAAGQCVIVSALGNPYVATNPAPITVALDTPLPAAGSARVDLLAARVLDSEADGGTQADALQLFTVSGTPAISPQPPTVPLGAVPLYVMTVANSGAITGITSVRPWTRAPGAPRRITNGDARVGSHPGDLRIDEATGQVDAWIGKKWLTIVSPAAWIQQDVAWTYAGYGANPGGTCNLGTGASSFIRYKRAGNDLQFAIRARFGKDPDMGTGVVTTVLPNGWTAPAGIGDTWMLCQVWTYDNKTNISQDWHGQALIQSGANVIRPYYSWNIGPRAAGIAPYQVAQSPGVANKSTPYVPNGLAQGGQQGNQNVGAIFISGMIELAPLVDTPTDGSGGTGGGTGGGSGTDSGVAAPANFAAVVQPDNSIITSWSPVPGVDYYTLVETQSPTGVKGATQLTTTSSVRTPSTLRDYTYGVVAVKGGVRSVVSNQVTVTLPYGSTSSGGGSGGTGSGGTGSGGTPQQSRPYIYTADWHWNPIGTNPALDPNSPAIVNQLKTGQHVADAVQYGCTLRGPDGITASTPRYKVKLSQTGSWGPDPFGGQSVPIPDGTENHLAPGDDKHLVIADPTTGKIFAIWQAKKSGSTWSGSWGAMVDLAGDGRETNGSSTGSGLSRFACVVRVAEIAAGYIPHALFFSTNIAMDGDAAGGVRYPATKSDGSNDSGVAANATIPEGARVQLDPSIDLSTIAGITAAELTVGRALQTFGAYCGDNGGARMAFLFELANDASGSNPGAAYSSKGLDNDYENFTHLPWDKLRVLKSWDAGTPVTSGGGSSGSGSGSGAGAASDAVVATNPTTVLDLTNWTMLLPTGTQGDPDNIYPSAAIANTFFTRADGGVCFRANAGGNHSPNSKFARTELRQMADHNWTKAAWPSSGNHALEVRQAIHRRTLSARPRIVGMQIHDAADDVCQLMLHETRGLGFMYNDGDSWITIDANYVDGTPYVCRFTAASDHIQVAYNGTAKVNIPKSGSGWYWKTGCYLQTDVATYGEQSAAYGDVIIYSIDLYGGNT